MANEIEITVRGNVGADPTLFDAAGTRPFAKFSVAVSARKFRRESQTYETNPPQWFTVKVNGDLALNVCESLRKGSPVLVRGELLTEQWEDKEGSERRELVVRANAVGLDLGNGTARYTKVVRGIATVQTPPSEPGAGTNTAQPPQAPGAEELSAVQDEEELEGRVAVLAGTAHGAPF